MDLIRRPSSTLGLSTFEEMDKLFDNFWQSVGFPASSVSLPSVDIYAEDDEHMVVEMPAPGFEASDIDISVRDNVLEIRGQKSVQDEQKDKRSYMVRESNSSFARRVVLPEGAEVDKISAELEKGLLKLSVPVSRPEAKRIKVKAGNTKGAKQIATKNK